MTTAQKRENDKAGGGWRGWLQRALGRSDIWFGGSLYMRRWRCVNAPRWLGGWGVRLHHIVRGDADRELHDHPFTFLSVVLWGGYLEYRERGPARLYRAGSVLWRRAEALHRLELPGGSTWTLVFRGPVRRAWGFQTARGWVGWRDFVDARPVPGLLGVAGVAGARYVAPSSQEGDGTVGGVLCPGPALAKAVDVAGLARGTGVVMEYWLRSLQAYERSAWLLVSGAYGGRPQSLWLSEPGLSRAEALTGVPEVLRASAVVVSLVSGLVEGCARAGVVGVPEGDLETVWAWCRGDRLTEWVEVCGQMVPGSWVHLPAAGVAAVNARLAEVEARSGVYVLDAGGGLLVDILADLRAEVPSGAEGVSLSLVGSVAVLSWVGGRVDVVNARELEAGVAAWLEEGAPS